jgi:hypothetical protein
LKEELKEGRGFREENGRGDGSENRRKNGK